MSIYESAGEFEDVPEEEDENVFASALENTQLLIMENYSRFINKFISGEYKSTKFEILTINDIKFDMNEKTIEINEIFLNINYMIILLIIKIMSKVQYFIDYDGKPIYTIEENFEEEENLNINLEKRINDTELQLFNNLKKKYQKNKNNLDDSDNEENNNDIFEESIGYSEEEKKKKEGFKIKINYISFKVNNISRDAKRFDMNIYYFNLFQELVYPNLSTIAGAKLSKPEKQYFQDILSPDYIELVLIDMDMIYYNISNGSNNTNIVFKELLMNYWNQTIIQYTNLDSKNDLNGNPNISISLPGFDMVVNFSENVKMNIDKNTIDNLLAFNNDFLYGLSMYQIYNKYCSDLYNNKLINLFEIFGLKNHIKAFKNIQTEEENKEEELNDKKINFDKRAIKEIERQMMKKKPNMSIGGMISSLELNINKNKSFDEEEGNLVKMKMENVSVSLEMFDTNEENININNNNKENKNNNQFPKKDSNEVININKDNEGPIYNVVTVSINNIFFLIKENQKSSENEESEPIYYNLFSKNKSSSFDSKDYFFMTFKFRNMKKIRDDITIIEDEEEEEDLDENQENNLNKKLSKESSSSNPKTKNSDQFKANNMKIALDPKTTDYIAFLLDNQVKLDNMEMVIDIKLSETVLNSFYDKLDSLTSSFNNLYLDFTDKKKENEGPFANPGDRIPLCEDRVMFIKCDFIFNHLLIDIFLKEEKENKDWMRLLLLIDNFEFIFNEIGIFLNLNKNYAFILKDFSYINDMKNINEENIYDIDEKINDIYKEDSYMKRFGYTELYYNDKITLNKMEKEMNVDLGNINMFFTKDSYNFVLDFFNQFSSKYLDKIKNIFSKKEENHEDDDEEEEEEKAEEKDKKELEELQNINKKMKMKK